MNWTEAPIGMIRHDELLNILTALQLSGGCDNRTLAIVAQATGLGDYFKPAQPIIVELPEHKRIEAGK